MLLTFWWEHRKSSREVDYVVTALRTELEENARDLRFEGIDDWSTVIIFPPLSDVALRGALAHPDVLRRGDDGALREAAIGALRATRDAEAYVVARNVLAASVPASKREEFNRSTGKFLAELVSPQLVALSTALDFEYH